MNTNLELMYSEYMGTNEAAHALNLLEGNKEKPQMVFTKSPVLSRVMELLPRLQESENALKGSENSVNIEVADEDQPFIEMDVALVGDKDEDMNLCDKVEDFEVDSDAESMSPSIMKELEPILEPIEVISKNDTQDNASVSQFARRSDEQVDQQMFRVIEEDVPIQRT